MAKIVKRVKIHNKPPVPEGMDYIFTENYGGIHLVIDASDKRVTHLIDCYFKKRRMRLWKVACVIQEGNEVTFYKHYLDYHEGDEEGHEVEDSFTFTLNDVLYSDYKQSEEWRKCAEACKEHASHRCQICNCRNTRARRLVAHHRTYERIGHEEPRDLIAVCERCHRIIHKHCSIY